MNITFIFYTTQIFPVSATLLLPDKHHIAGHQWLSCNLQSMRIAIIKSKTDNSWDKAPYSNFENISFLHNFDGWKH